MLKSIKFLVLISISTIFIVLSSIFLILWFFGLDLPNYRFLENYKPSVSTKIYNSKGELVANFSKEKRSFVSITNMPSTITNAFLSAEDKNFFKHPGIDAKGISRAIIKNIKNVMNNRRLEGASTITQQVAKNFLLTSDISFSRKIKEAILAFRIEKYLSKKRILELYLNEIYLGERSYGVASASMTYFDKSLNELSISEAALLATLPKAPSTYNPYRNFSQSMNRKNWVLNRMFENNFINKKTFELEKNKKINLKKKIIKFYKENQYFTEEVRRFLNEKYGDEILYKKGLYVKTSLNNNLQKLATNALRKHLEIYDRRHGWRGPLMRLKDPTDWQKKIKKIKKDYLNNWEIAIVKNVNKNYALIENSKNTKGKIFLKNLKWSRKYLTSNSLGPPITDVSQVLNVNDVIFVRKKRFSQSWDLKQIPKANGSVVLLNPTNGNILALVGGYSFDMSKFNRASQAKRQPGSAFKPFVYATALENGFQPNSILLDAPYVFNDLSKNQRWKPSNYGNKFYGLNTLRTGIEKSRNLMTVRLSQIIGNKKILDFSEKVGIYKKPLNILSFSLGSEETTLLNLTNAYSIFVNGGRIVQPSLIDYVQDQTGKTIYKKKSYVCTGCNVFNLKEKKIPIIRNLNKKILSDETSFQISSILEGVIDRGTAKKMKNIQLPLAGKTGTTNNNFDAWFVGYTTNLVIGVYVGFDEPETLGKFETGSKVALPIFQEIIKKISRKNIDPFFKIPSTINLAYTNKDTGLISRIKKENSILEGFKEKNAINNFYIDNQLKISTIY